MTDDRRPTTRFRIAWATMMGFRGEPFTKREFIANFVTDQRARGASFPKAWASAGMVELRDAGWVVFDGRAWRSTLPV